jgi:hypothetical protein
MIIARQRPRGLCSILRVAIDSSSLVLGYSICLMRGDCLRYAAKVDVQFDSADAIDGVRITSWAISQGAGRDIDILCHALEAADEFHWRRTYV